MIAEWQNPFYFCHPPQTKTKIVQEFEAPFQSDEEDNIKDYRIFSLIHSTWIFLHLFIETDIFCFNFWTNHQSRKKVWLHLWILIFGDLVLEGLIRGVYASHTCCQVSGWRASPSQKFGISHTHLWNPYSQNYSHGIYTESRCCMLKADRRLARKERSGTQHRLQAKESRVHGSHNLSVIVL